jgi:hypothetical protein
VTAYRTTFDLDLPTGADIPLAFDFALDFVDPYRTLIYVNGWQFGRYPSPVHMFKLPLTIIQRFLSSLGPQVSYPIPEGILNHHGTNDVLISLWALSSSLFQELWIQSNLLFSSDATGARMSKLELNKRTSLTSSKIATIDIVPAPGWAELRGNITTN